MNTNQEERITDAARLALANQLFREFRTSCFWHMKPDLVVTEELLPIIIKGLQTHGGRRGLLAAEKLKK